MGDRQDRRISTYLRRRIGSRFEQGHSGWSPPSCGASLPECRGGDESRNHYGRDRDWPSSRCRSGNVSGTPQRLGESEFAALCARTVRDRVTHLNRRSQRLFGQEIAKVTKKERIAEKRRLKKPQK